MRLARISKLLKSVSGSYTLEAATIIPFILLLLISLVFLAMYLYQQLFLLDTVIYSAKQRAATWDNSHKKMEDGFQTVLADDGLYWQLLNDNLVGANSTLVSQKLSYGERFIRSTLAQGAFRSQANEIKLEYTNQLLKRTVKVKVTENPLLPVALFNNFLNSQLVVEAEAEVVEPVEFIRNIDLAERYGRELASGLGGLINPLAQEEQQPKQARLVYASSQSKDKLYHYPNCFHIGNIKKGNLQTLPEVAAISQGYGLCLHCAKGKLNK